MNTARLIVYVLLSQLSACAAATQVPRVPAPKPCTQIPIPSVRTEDVLIGCDKGERGTLRCYYANIMTWEVYMLYRLGCHDPWINHGKVTITPQGEIEL